MRDKIRTKWKELAKYPVLVFFFVFIFAFLVVDVLWPKRASSDLERRPLKQAPAFNWSDLIQNKWTAAYDAYTKDQVVGRDAWLKLQSRSESLLFAKKEIGGALLGDDDQLFTKMFALKPLEERQLKTNIKILQDFMARHDGDVTLMLAPSASLIYEERVPAKAPMLDENAYLDRIFDTLGEKNCMDLRPVFTENKNDYQLFYNTDHHWTTEGGAYLAYQEFCRRQGMEPLEYSEESYKEIPNFYGTTYSKCVLWSQKPDTVRYLDLPNRMTVWNSNGLGELTPNPNFGTAEDPSVGLYDMEKANTADKYAVFLHGNNGYSTIEGTGEGKLLVVKDSYANCFVPFLTSHYAQIGVIDPRGYKLPIDKLMEQEGYDQVLLLFNFQSFVSNNNLAFLHS